MITKTTYHCELCDTSYTTPEEALACEARGPGATYPIGMMWRVKLSDLIRKRPVEHAERYTYAIARESKTSNGHVQSYVQFVMSSGDVMSRREDVPPGGVLVHAKPFEPTRAQPPDLSLLSFRRMVDALLTAGITPTMWDGEKVIPLPPEFERSAP